MNDLTKRLLDVVKTGKDFEEQKVSVWEFITAMDSDEAILGDGDLAELFAESLKRRGKPLSTGQAILSTTFTLPPGFSFGSRIVGKAREADGGQDSLSRLTDGRVG